MFTFRHLAISGVSCYSCLCLEIVPLLILLPSISRRGRLALSSEFQWSEQSLQASSPLSEKVHSYLVFGPPPGWRWRPKTGSFQEAVLLWPGRWPVVWSWKWRCLRRSLALACPRNCWPLYSTPSPVQPALRGVPEPRWLLPEPEAETSQAGWIPVLSPGRLPVVWSRRSRIRILMQKNIGKLGDTLDKVQWGYQMLNDYYTKESNANIKTGRNWTIKQQRQSHLYLRSVTFLEARCEVFTLPGQGLSCPGHGSN